MHRDISRHWKLTLSKWTSWPAIWVMCWKTCVVSLMKENKTKSKFKDQGIYFSFLIFVLKHFKLKPINVIHRKTQLLSSNPMSRPLFLFRRDCKAITYQFLGYQAAEQKLVLISSLSQSCYFIIHKHQYLFMSSETPTVSLISSLLPFWTPSLLILCSQSPQVSGYNFGPSSTLVQ